MARCEVCGNEYSKRTERCTAARIAPATPAKAECATASSQGQGMRRASFLVAALLVAYAAAACDPKPASPPKPKTETASML